MPVLWDGPPPWNRLKRQVMHMACPVLQIAGIGYHGGIVGTALHGRHMDRAAPFAHQIRHPLPQEGIGSNAACNHEAFYIRMPVQGPPHLGFKRFHHSQVE